MEQTRIAQDNLEKVCPTLRTFLLTESFGKGEEDAFDKPMRDIRHKRGPFMIDDQDDPRTDISA